jgi:arylsulfatase A-like enzyme
MTTRLPTLIALLFVATIRLPAAERPPNVVLFVVDDMGWMDSSVYGSKYYETPHMERLAKQAMRFTNAYAVPLCSPTRASILTGQYSSRHGVTSASGHQPAAAEGASPYPEKDSPSRRLLYPASKNYLDPHLVTLAEVLRGAGYRTGHFGKWHLGIAPEHRPDRHGFETAWYCVPDPGPPSYFSPYGVHAEGNATGNHRVGTITDGPQGEYVTDRLADEAVAFVERHRGEPFFLNLWQYGVHGPWGHEVEKTRRFAEKTDPRGLQKNPIMASMLESVDDGLGRVLDKLDELDLTENTLFVFFSDNGGNAHSNRADDPKLARLPPNHPRQAFVRDWRRWAGGEPPTNNAPLREGKGRIYEGGQRVPLMVRWPGRVPPGTVSDEVVGAIDLYPTILDAVGLERPAGHVVDGASLVPVLDQEGQLDREAYFTWFPHLIPAVSVRAGDWKLIRRWEPHPGYPAVRELYHLGEDVGETRNLAADRPEKVAELDALIDRFIAETDPLVPKPNPAFEPTADGGTDPLRGLVPKFAKAEIVEGALRVRADGREPFLGTGRVKNLTGPLTVKLRLRGPAGESTIRWKTAAQESFPSEQSVAYTLGNSQDWQDVSVRVPVEGRPAIVRLYLPATAARAVDVASIEVEGSQGRSVSWDFRK